MKQISIHSKIALTELEEMSQKMFGTLVKAVIDIEKEIMMVDAQLHADQELVLLEEGSEQNNLWGINIIPDKKGNYTIQFDSMINMRPSFGNCSRSVDDPKIQEKIKLLVVKMIKI